MTNLRKKSPDARRTRRQRYIHAIEPFRKQFNCTAAEVHVIIQRILHENLTLRTTITEMTKNNKVLQAKITELENKLTTPTE